MNHTDQPASMIGYLVPTWQRVLNRPVIHAEDNFFDLGGDLTIAGELFHEIAGSVGRELPPLTILQAPTILELAKFLEQPRRPKFPDIVLLKKGSGAPPIFMTHGLGGSVMEILNLARSLPSSHVVYGLQAPGSDGREKPLRRVEDLADLFLPAIRDVQPHGPYLLVGYSLGGLVMMEIAHRLRDCREKVALLAMLDGFPHRNTLSIGPRISLFRAIVKRHAKKLVTMPLRKKLGYLVSRTERDKAFPNNGMDSAPPPSGLLSSPELEHFVESGMAALRSYRPRFYAGRMSFVRAAKVHASLPADPVAVWRNLVEEMELDTVPGDHYEIVTRYYREVGVVLTRYLAAAMSETRP